MKLSVAAFALFVSLTSTGCSESGSPVSPSAIRPGSSSAVTATEGGTAAAPSASDSATVTIQGRLQGEADPPVPQPPPYIQVHLEATGQASHWGRFTLDFTHLVNLETNEGSGDAVFTLPNGDMVMTHAEGLATPVPGSDSAFTVVETHKVTGGTGRWAGASGEFTITRAVDFANPYTSGRIEGWISAPRGPS